MKKLICFVLCVIFMLSLSACTKKTTTVTPSKTTEKIDVQNVDGTIVGTWMCEDISKDCYFIFGENGDAYAKWGSCTVYGYYDEYEEDGEYDIDIPGFLFNIYTATFKDNSMLLVSDSSQYFFERAEMPTITIDAPDNLKIDEKILGKWASADSYEFYEFKQDGVAFVTDMANYSTVECRYDCAENTITMYAMATDKRSNVTELKYEILDGKIKIGDLIYEPVQE